jgi:hypothetical protein
MLNPGHTTMGVGAAVSATGKWFVVADFGQQGGPGAGPGGGGQLTRSTITVTNRSHQTINLILAGRQYTLVPGAWASAWQQTTDPNFHFSLGYRYRTANGIPGVGGYWLPPNRNYLLVDRGSGVDLVSAP